jgi:hypothetical protein
VKEFRFVSFSFPEPEAVTRLLRHFDLERLASPPEPRGCYCQVRLEAHDPRLFLLLDELERVGGTPTVRAEREYSRRELDAFEWLVLRVRTAGLSGGINFKQPYDFAAACAFCGAGATAIPPLIADLRGMGKKAIDRTAHDGHVIVSRVLADMIRNDGLTGVEFLPTRRRSQKAPDEQFLWMNVISQWGPMSASSVVVADDRCPECGRSGHYDAYSKVTEFRYVSFPADAPDFNRTWEYFGLWRVPAHMEHLKDGPNVGGARMLIVSQRVRRCFQAAKVRGVSFDPVLPESGRVDLQSTETSQA